MLEHSRDFVAVSFWNTSQKSDCVFLVPEIEHCCLIVELNALIVGLLAREDDTIAARLWAVCVADVMDITAADFLVDHIAKFAWQVQEWRASNALHCSYLVPRPCSKIDEVRRE